MSDDSTRGPAPDAPDSPPTPDPGAATPPAYGAPEQPAYGTSERPAYGAPPAPPHGAPAPPAYGVPAAPSYGTPEQPAYGAPAPYGAPAGGGYPPAPPAYGAPQYGATPAYTPYPTGPKTNVLAIISMIASIVGFIWILPFVGSVAGAIMGHISLSQLKKTDEKGRGMALAGVIVGWAGVAVFVVIGIFIIWGISWSAMNGARYRA